jgi:hypothetical protein
MVLLCSYRKTLITAFRIFATAMAQHLPRKLQYRHETNLCPTEARAFVAAAHTKHGSETRQKRADTSAKLAELREHAD